MQRWVACGLVVAMGCAGADMRPRGRRNALRIDALEKRLASVEGRDPAPAVTGPAGSPDARLAALEARLHALEAALARVEARVDTWR